MSSRYQSLLENTKKELLNNLIDGIEYEVCTIEKAERFYLDGRVFKFHIDTREGHRDIIIIDIDGRPVSFNEADLRYTFVVPVRKKEFVPIQFETIFYKDSIGRWYPIYDLDEAIAQQKQQQRRFKVIELPPNQE